MHQAALFIILCTDIREMPKVKKAIAMLVETGWLTLMEPPVEVRGIQRKTAYHIVRASGDVV